MNCPTMTRFCNASLKRRLLSRVECFLSSSDPVTSGWHKPSRREKKLTALESPGCAKPEYKVPMRKRADCRAEQYEMTGSPSDVPAESVLVGETSEVSPWWQKFPKRWTIVVLCFFSFLLCNMDRVSHLLQLAIIVLRKVVVWVLIIYYLNSARST